jgi:hypothetical protein
MSNTKQLQAQIEGLTVSRNFWMSVADNLRNEFELTVPIGAENTLRLYHLGDKWYVTEYSVTDDIVVSHPLGYKTRAEAIKFMNSLLTDEERVSGIEQAQLREETELTRFLITYNVNLIHQVEVNARDEKHAEEVFEEMYRDRHDELPEYHDISHEVVDVEPTAMQ